MKKLAWLVAAVLMVVNIAVASNEAEAAEGVGLNYMCVYRHHSVTDQCAEFCDPAEYYHCGGVCTENGSCQY